MIPAINIDTILSDPLLIVAAVLLVVSPVVFLVALVKFMRAPKPPKARMPFAIPHDDLSSPVASLAPIEPPPAPPAPAAKQQPASLFESAPMKPVVPAPSAPAAIPDAEKTVVLPPGTGEVQGQLEIALTQIRTLNKKIYDLETTVSTLVRSAGAAGTTTPGASSDVSTKLQTLAEHVIILEKEVARLKTAHTPAETPAAAAERRPPMPL